MRVSHSSSEKLTVVRTQAVLEREDGRWWFKTPAAGGQVGEVSVKTRMQVLD